LQKSGFNPRKYHVEFEMVKVAWSRTNNIRKTTKPFTKHQTQRHTPVIRGRRGLTYTELDTTAAAAQDTRPSFDQTLRRTNLTTSIDI
jgi:hypothetical protein